MYLEPNGMMKKMLEELSRPDFCYEMDSNSSPTTSWDESDQWCKRLLCLYNTRKSIYWVLTLLRDYLCLHLTRFLVSDKYLLKPREKCASTTFFIYYATSNNHVTMTNDMMTRRINCQQRTMSWGHVVIDRHHWQIISIRTSRISPDACAVNQCVT